MNVKYQEIETYFSELIVLLKVHFSHMEIDEVAEFIDHNEYGLALDTVIDIIVEENKKIDGDIYHLIINLSNTMELDSDDISRKLNLNMY